LTIDLLIKVSEAALTMDELCKLCQSINPDRVLVIGTIASGKSFAVGRIKEQLPESEINSIDNFRRDCDASTEAGESDAQAKFLRAMSLSNGIFEFTGAGPLFASVEDICYTNPFDLVVRIHSPVDACVQRVQTRRSWPPYPHPEFPGRKMIVSINEKLDSQGFRIDSNYWREQKLVHVRGWKIGA
jgi:hypothetical protein